MSQPSKLELYRAEREDLASGRRTAIVDAAEAVFLERGIEDTTMGDIADRVGVSRVTLYRYFAERDHLAYTVAGRMLDRLAEAARAGIAPGTKDLDAIRAGFLALVASFDEHQDAHRFLFMFDATTMLRKPDKRWERWYRSRVRQAATFNNAELFAEHYDPATVNRLIALANAVLGPLGRFAIQRDPIAKDERAAIEGPARESRGPHQRQFRQPHQPERHRRAQNVTGARESPEARSKPSGGQPSRRLFVGLP